MKGLNVTVVSGHVGSVQFGVTRGREEEVCSFMLHIEKSKDIVTKIRVNVYGADVVSCRKFLRTGIPVAVHGELMNRFSVNKQDTLLEVRCLDIKFGFLNAENKDGQVERKKEECERECKVQ